MHSVIPDTTFGDLTLRFPYDPRTGRVGLLLFPESLAARVVPRRANVGGLPFLGELAGSGNSPGQMVDSLVQVKLAGDDYSGRFAQGHTMRESPTLDAFRYDGQRIAEAGRVVTLTTRLQGNRGLRLEHHVRWHRGEQAIEVSTGIHNDSDRAAIVEMLSSFSLGSMTPFDRGDAPGRLRVHRFRSSWSAEARLESRSIEDLHLERSWSGASAQSERFGQVGTMPVRRWFPLVALEDTHAGVVWGAQLSWAGSWQMEIFRQHDDVCLSGGLADREFGHWTKTIAPGESLITPPAAIACVHGDLDALCDRLTGAQTRGADLQPPIEHDLPIIFNEWCASWGDPKQADVLAAADRLAGTDVRYLVIDAGWYQADGHDWSRGHGDWHPNTRLFPGGIAEVARDIRNRGLIPGLWFEFETAGSQSAAFEAFADHFLKRDGVPLTLGDRRFWDLNDQAAVDYLAERVIGQLEECGFGYLKVDYNETLGLGSDHSDGLGEGLRRQVLASYSFLDRIRERQPNLVIENCAAGGHRLEPSMLARTAMSSFSDAHELVEIPIIAANLHRLMLPRQSQIWAVLRPTDSERRIVYSLSATFLGRMCLSGNIQSLSEPQWQLAVQAQRLYRRAAPIIKLGRSRCFGSIGASRRHPCGWQAVFRTGVDERYALAVVHTFAGTGQQEIAFSPGGSWKLVDSFSTGESLEFGDRFRWRAPGDFSAMVALVERA